MTPWEEMDQRRQARRALQERNRWARAEGWTAVYLLFGEGGLPLYIGHTKDPERRFREHRRKGWPEEILSMVVEWCPSRRAARWVEAELLCSIPTRYNSEDEVIMSNLPRKRW